MPQREVVYGLSAAELTVLRRVVEEYVQRVSSRGAGLSLDDADHEEMLAPEVYVARAPAGGIPALETAYTGTGTGLVSSEVMGRADCDVYRVVQDDAGRWVVQAVTGLDKTVFNLGRSAVPAGKIVPIKRDKFGEWVVYDPQETSHVYVSSKVPDVNGNWRAYLTAWSGSAWTTGRTVSLKSPNNETLTVGRRYLARNTDLVVNKLQVWASQEVCCAGTGTGGMELVVVTNVCPLYG